MEHDDLVENLKKLEIEKEELQTELRRLNRKPDAKTGYLLLLIGLVFISLAVVYSHNVSAFIGIALTFWGALLFYIRPTRFIKKELLDSTIIDPIQNIHKLLDELEFNGTPIYISPGTLRGLLSSTVFIPKTDQYSIPSDDQLSQEEAFLKNLQGIKLTPPGLGLSKLLEKELKTNFSTVDLIFGRARPHLYLNNRDITNRNNRVFHLPRNEQT